MKEPTISVSLTYRLLGPALPPRPIRVEKPGWGGKAIEPRDGARPQPWHCLPFVEGSTYGLELLYSLESECQVLWRNGTLVFDGAFEAERVAKTVWPPFLSTNPGHYSLGTLIDIQVPEGWALRVEPHPRFFTDETGTVPAAVIGNLETSWWPMFFFVTFKSPAPGQVHTFRKGEPYAQVIPVPRRPAYSIAAMTENASREREELAQQLMRSRNTLSKRRWKSGDGLYFDDLYKQLLRHYEKHGMEDLRAQISEVSCPTRSKKA